MVVPDPTTIDFNNDRSVDVADLDALVGQIVAGTNDTAFDLSGDGTVNDTDLTAWLFGAANHNGFSQAYLVGDSNLDGSVNSADLNNLGLNWQQNVAALWSGGDFTADGLVNSADLNALGLNWQATIAIAASVNAPVPEPSAMVMTIFALALIWRRYV